MAQHMEKKPAGGCSHCSCLLAFPHCCQLRAGAGASPGATTTSPGRSQPLVPYFFLLCFFFSSTQPFISAFPQPHIEDPGTFLLWHSMGAAQRPDPSTGRGQWAEVGSFSFCRASPRLLARPRGCSRSRGR